MEPKLECSADVVKTVTHGVIFIIKTRTNGAHCSVNMYFLQTNTVL